MIDSKAHKLYIMAHFNAIKICWKARKTSQNECYILQWLSEDFTPTLKALIYYILRSLRDQEGRAKRESGWYKWDADADAVAYAVTVASAAPKVNVFVAKGFFVVVVYYVTFNVGPCCCWMHLGNYVDSMSKCCSQGLLLILVVVSSVLTKIKSSTKMKYWKPKVRQTILNRNGMKIFMMLQTF